MSAVNARIATTKHCTINRSCAVRSEAVLSGLPSNASQRMGKVLPTSYDKVGPVIMVGEVG
jgi:hypothetical protein